MKLSTKEKKLIMKSIEEAEFKTSGEIRVHLSYSAHDDEPLTQAQLHFEKLKMHLTRDRNGILLYINPKAKRFALYGDRGINEKLGQHYWEELKNQLRKDIHDSDLTTGIVNAVLELGNQLKHHFPYTESDKNELHNDLSESD
jgi:uncharacterized membrane protein